MRQSDRGPPDLRATLRELSDADGARKIRRQLRRRQARGRRTGSTRAWRTLRAEILAFNPLCAHCGGLATNLDHLKPASEGGAELGPACASSTAGRARAGNSLRLCPLC